MQSSEVSGPINMQMKGANENARGSRISGEFIRVGGYDDEDGEERMTRPRRSYVEAGVRVKVERATKVTSVAYLPVIPSAVFCDFMHDLSPRSIACKGFDRYTYCYGPLNGTEALYVLHVL